MRASEAIRFPDRGVSDVFVTNDEPSKSRADAFRYGNLLPGDRSS
jgi:hypothetical protein